MEFYATVPGRFTAGELQQEVDIASLPDWCDAIDRILSHQGEKGRLYCLWGEFEVERTLIRGGVRFSLLDCPNALAWTLTTDLPPDPDAMVVHLTINRPAHEADFVESMQAFVEAWRQGIERRLRADGIAEYTNN